MKPNNMFRLCLSTIITTCVLVACGGKESKEKIDDQDKVQLQIDDSLQKQLSDYSKMRRVKGNLSFYVYDLTADKPIFGYQENKPLPAASCMKLLSGIAGLHLLGIHYKYITGLYISGEIENGELKGNVGLKGSLDPQFNEKEMSFFAKKLHQRGVKKVCGKVVLDLVLRKPVTSEPHWYPWDLSFSKYGIFYKGEPRIVKAWTSALRAQGIVVSDSQVVVARLTHTFKPVYRFGRSISMVINKMWKNSSNTQSTALVYTIGHKINSKTDPTATGVSYIKRFIAENLSIADTSIVIHDGCGLCTYNRLTAFLLTRVLKYGYHHPDIYKVLQRELSLSGIDGTLKHELTNTLTRGKIRAKTGTLSHPYGISSLAGYCKGRNGHTLAFAIINTEMSVLDAHVLQRRLCERLVE